MSKKNTKPKFIKKKRKLSLFKLIIFLLLAAIIAFFAIEEVRIMKLSQEENQLKQRNEQLTNQKNDLENELEHINSDSFIERFARGTLKLIRPNELLFVFPEGGLKVKKQETGENLTTDENSDESSKEAQGNENPDEGTKQAQGAENTNE